MDISSHSGLPLPSLSPGVSQANGMSKMCKWDEIHRNRAKLIPAPSPALPTAHYFHAPTPTLAPAKRKAWTQQLAACQGKNSLSDANGKGRMLKMFFCWGLPKQQTADSAFKSDAELSLAPTYRGKPKDTLCWLWKCFRFLISALDSFFFLVWDSLWSLTKPNWFSTT